jgi:hypothetical protein
MSAAATDDDAEQEDCVESEKGTQRKRTERRKERRNRMPVPHSSYLMLNAGTAAVEQGLPQLLLSVAPAASMRIGCATWHRERETHSSAIRQPDNESGVQGQSTRSSIGGDPARRKRRLFFSPTSALAGLAKLGGFGVHQMVFAHYCEYHRRYGSKRV